MNAFQVDEYLIVISPLLHSSSSCSKPIEQQTQKLIMLPLLLFLFFFISFSCFILFTLYKKLKKTEKKIYESNTHDPNVSIVSTINNLNQTSQNKKPHYFFFEIFNSTSSTAELGSSHFSVVEDNGDVSNDVIVDGSELDKDGGSDLVEGEDCEKNGKKKKKRGKKKRRNSQTGDGGEEPNNEISVLDFQHKHCLDCLYPFTSSSSVTQRKLKQQYDQLVKSNHSKGLTMAQVGEFVNSLVEARNELQHKSETIQRKFTITKALLMKADRSSLDRLSQQLYKLEAEQKRLEEDASVYNRLQQQLKLSPAYKKMLEIGASMELKARSGQVVENADNDFTDISFEELLAREKKDTFWRKNGKLRSCMN
ncbi:hypothetical protein AQUCO_00100068v1 [Aquilegia coerulea]|uniref:Uncharacterized protein n=1 Tax=Aquilegia coerulea TaxID=218851 RepID=A0A2G5F8K2_AQUCA|nr:hypothetical protein AQUCO_00100068v1 [Aquilegia coerulea]